MKEWEKNKQWSDAFLPEIKQILGLYLIGEANQEEDCKHNTDLIVLNMAAVRIACRVRRVGFLSRFQDEFTIRSRISYGGKTEITKIIEGWGDYFFYGHDGGNGKLAAWYLCSLHVFRLWFTREIVKHNGLVPGKEKTNTDGSSSFRAFSFFDLPENFVVAQMQHIEEPSHDTDVKHAIPNQKMTQLVFDF